MKSKEYLPKPEYPGGTKALNEFINLNLKYPQDALDNKIEGTVALRLTIDYRGKVTKVKINKTLGYGCDDEAMRLVYMLEFKVPKMYNLKLIYFKNINIHFKLPPPQSQISNIVYTIQTEAAAPAKTTYNYIITISEK